MRCGRAFSLVAIAAATGACALVADLGDKKLLPPPAPAEEAGAADAPSVDSGQTGKTGDTVLAGLARPRGVVVDVSSIFFTEENAGTLKRLKKTEKTPVVLAKNQLSPTQLTLDARYIYWRNESRVAAGGTDYPSIARMDKDKDERVQPTTLYNESVSPSEVKSISLFDPTDGRVENLLFFTRRDRVSRKARDNFQGEQSIAQNQGGPTEIAADEDYVYWVTVDDYAIRRQKKDPFSVDGGPNASLETLYASTDRAIALALAVDDENIYWVDQLGRVFKKGKTSAALEVELAQSGSTATASLVIDRDDVYWTNGDRGTVSTVPKNGGAADKKILAEQQDAPRELTVDPFETPHPVYWSTATAIMTSAKP